MSICGIKSGHFLIGSFFSMEIFAFHPGLNKWVEIGNSGMFRPEMLLPMGLPGKSYETDLRENMSFI